MAARDGYRIKDRSARLEKRKNAMPKNGVALKRLLIERAAKAQAAKRD